LTDQQIETIRSAAADIYGPDAEVWLFGSRADDLARGGDIDLYIETGKIDPKRLLQLETRFWIRLQRLLGERRIDVVSRASGQPMQPIHNIARREGIRL